jgi:phospholipid/cholesterol/gamma-HCH transport system permease protein
MEASRAIIVRPAPPAPRPLSRGLTGPVLRVFEELGAMLAFAGQAFWELRGVWRYFSEVLRQIAILITGSAVVMWCGVFIFSMQCGLESEYIFRSFGASGYTGTVTSVCHMKMMTALLMSWFFAAKVGAGLAAELGAMRINDEISAMEALGINTVRYIVSTRLAAVLIVMPFLWFLSLGVAYGGYLAFISSVGDISSGAFSTVHWQFQDLHDVVGATTLAMTQVIIVTIVALYYGYNASGGPIGVGTGTAKAMTVNLIAPLLAQALLGAVFWGAHYNAPVGG